MLPVRRIRSFADLVERRGWTQAQASAFLRSLFQLGHPDAPAPVEGGSANFVQVSGPGGRTQTLNAAAGPVTFIWNPQSLKGQLAGGDFLYASRIKVRTILHLTNALTTNNPEPNWQILAQALGNVRVFSQFLGELVPKNLNSVPLLANHDQYFVNGFKPITRKRPLSTQPGGNQIQLEYIFEIPFERDYLERSTDSCPWLPFLEGGIIEVDLAPAGALSAWGWTITSATQTCTIDYFLDKQALIHTPIQSRLYRVTTTGPEYVLKSVGSPNGLDGVISGSRLAILSWLAKGIQSQNSALGSPSDAGFYAAFGNSGGIGFGTAGLTRLDIPFRDQVSIDDVSAWLESFLADCNPIRMFENLNIGSNNGLWNDVNQWPFIMQPGQALEGSFPLNPPSLVGDPLDFWPLVWPGRFEKIADMQKVNGDLSFTATLTTPPGNAVLHLFRTDEVCGFTPDKVHDLMERMGLPHAQKGGAFEVVPKFAGAKKADLTTTFGMPLKIVSAKG